MPLSLADILNDERTTTLEVLGETVNITFRPSVLTAEIEKTLYMLTQSNRLGAAAVEKLAAVLVRWDLLDDQGQPLPVDAKTLATQVPVAFLMMVVKAINAANQEDAETPKGSAAGLPPAAKSAKRRTGGR